jgi:hypothetical protein
LEIDFTPSSFHTVNIDSIVEGHVQVEWLAEGGFLACFQSCEILENSVSLVKDEINGTHQEIIDGEKESLI